MVRAHWKLPPSPCLKQVERFGNPARSLISVEAVPWAVVTAQLDSILLAFFVNLFFKLPSTLKVFTAAIVGHHSNMKGNIWQIYIKGKMPLASPIPYETIIKSTARAGIPKHNPWLWTYASFEMVVSYNSLNASNHFSKEWE